MGCLFGTALLTIGGVYAAKGDQVPRHTTIAGVDVGQQSPQEAADTLAEALADDLAQPIQVRVDDVAGKVTPAEVGISLDAQASVAASTGARWSPTRIWRYFFGGGEHEAVFVADEAQADTAFARLNQSLGEPVVEGTITFRDATPQAVPGKAGTGIDPQPALELLVGGVLAGEVIELPTTRLVPRITAEVLEQTMREFAEPAMAAPVVIRVPGAKAVAPPKLFAPALTMEPRNGQLVPQVNAKKLLRNLEPVLEAIGEEPQDAAFEVVDGKVKIIPATVGANIDPHELADALPAVLPQPKGERVIKLDTTTVKPAFTTKDARKLGIKEEVSTFTTYFPYAHYRNVNLARAAELIDGTILKPGETFSLNQTVGERTAENGFISGWVIQDGIFRQALGGGVSQIATTTFNAMFFAGLEDVEHKPHSVYIDRYPEGREATVAWPSLDLKFKNNTDYGILIKARVGAAPAGGTGSATVTMYSTKTWEITSTKSARYAFTSPSVRYLDAPDCAPATGSSGFQVDVYRHFARASQPDKEVKTEKFHTVYIPSATLRCGTPESHAERNREAKRGNQNQGGPQREGKKSSNSKQNRKGNQTNQGSQSRQGGGNSAGAPEDD